MNSANKSKKKIIYIMGAGRSGTTLFDILLGNSEEIFSAGEVYKFPKLKGCPHGFDENTNHFKFWKKVEQSFFAKFNGKGDYDSLSKLSKQIEFHRGFIPAFLGIQSKKKSSLYKQYVNHFFSSVFENIDKPVIVDSSKYPLRALALYRHSDHEINFIYLQRNPVEVVNSFFQKEIEQPSKNFLSANFYYFIINMMCRWVLKKIQGSKLSAYKPKVVVIKYNNLIANPIVELQKIQSAFEIDLSKTILKIENNQPLHTGLLFEGNRIRLSEAITFNSGKKIYKRKFRDYFTAFFNSCWWRE